MHENINKELLFVDDESEILDLAVRLAQSKNISVKTADSAGSAFSLIERNPSNYFLIIADLNMPGIKGDELLKKVKSEWPDIQCALLSSNEPNPETVANFKESGLLGFYKKPLQSEPFFNLLQLAWELNQSGKINSLSEYISKRSAIFDISHHDKNFENIMTNFKVHYLSLCQQIWNTTGCYESIAFLKIDDDYENYALERTRKHLYKLFSIIKRQDKSSHTSTVAQYTRHLGIRTRKEDNMPLTSPSLDVLFDSINEYLKKLSLSPKGRVKTQRYSLVLDFYEPYIYSDLYNPFLSHSNEAFTISLIHLEIFFITYLLELDISIDRTSNGEVRIELK